MKVLITGGAGFPGRKIVSALLEEGIAATVDGLIAEGRQCPASQMRVT